RRCKINNSPKVPRSKAMAEQQSPETPDLTKGVKVSELTSGKLLGHVGDKEVLLIKADEEVLAIDAHCTHYSGPLAEGLVVGTTVRCPWHHACFDLKTGEALRAPALSPLTCWTVEEENGLIFVRSPREASKPGRAAALGT